MERVPEGFYQHVTWGLLWFDGEMPGEDYSTLPLWHFWPDLEMFSVRSSWQDDAVALVFKCGPPGGHRLQQLGAGHWFNVAHDHPDQMHFLLYAFGKFLAEDDGYPKEKKLTRSHNTLLFDGQGGPREDTGWYQPFPYEQTATMREIFLSQSSAFSTGDATALYAAVNSAVAKVARHLFFVEGGYLVLMDELVGNDGQMHDFEWRLHKEGSWSAPAEKSFYVTDGEVGLDIKFLEPPAITYQFLPAELTAKPALSVRTRASEARFVSVLLPQKDGQPQRDSEFRQTAEAFAVKSTSTETIDVIALARASEPFSVYDVSGKGRAAVVRKRSGNNELAFLVRGTELRTEGNLLLVSSPAANLALRTTSTGATLEAEAPYREIGALTDVSLGGFSPGRPYRVEISDGQILRVAADGQGVIAFRLDLSERRSAVITETTEGPDAGDGNGDDVADAGDFADRAEDSVFADGGEDGGQGEAIDQEIHEDFFPPDRVAGECGCSTPGGEAILLTGLLAFLFLRRLGRRGR